MEAKDTVMTEKEAGAMHRFEDFRLALMAQATLTWPVAFKAGQEDERAKWIIEAKSGSRKAFLSLPIEERRIILKKQAQELADAMHDSQAKDDLRMME